MRKLVAGFIVGLGLVHGPSAAEAASTSVVISEFRTRGPNGSNDEFIELFNVSNGPVNITGYTVRVSDAAGSTSTIVTIPTFTLPSKRFYLLINNGTQGYSGTTNPNAGYTIGIPDNGGIALFNASGGLVDAVGMSATSAYFEGTPLAPMTRSVNQSYVRKDGGCSSTQDTDDNSANFTFNAVGSSPSNSTLSCTANPCAGILCRQPPSACYSNPGTCVSGACVYTPFAVGAACTDGNACTVGDTCDGTLACVSGPAATCDSPPANTCSDSKTLVTYAAVGACSTTSGCSYAATTTNCPFGCNGTTKACNADPCSSVSCNVPPNGCYQSSGTCVSGACSYPPRAAGTSCDDGDPCTENDACNGSGTCQAGTPKSVDDGNPCTADACDSATGTVTHTPVTDGTNCDDGDLCNGIAVCSAGVCTPGTPKTCDTPPIGGCYAPTGTCVPSNGACSYQPAAPGTACDDGNACTQSDACDGNGNCGGSAVVCTADGPTCFDVNTSRTQTPGTCQPDGSCTTVYSFKRCDFGCDTASGLCKNDPCIGVTCDSPPSSCYLPAGTCSGGKCSYTVADGAACDDSDPCTSNDTCTSAGVCAGTPLACNTPAVPSCKDANTSTTYDAAGTCSNATCSYQATDTACTKGCDPTSGLCNGDPCKGVTCDSPPDQCHQTNGTCGSDGKCTYALKAVGSACDDGQACTTDDACDAAGTCAGTTACNAPPATTCDATKPISHGFEATGTCNTTGSCTYVGIDRNCAAGCDAATGLCKDDPCAGVICNAPPTPCFNAVGTCGSDGQCTYAPRDDKARCDDGELCTTDDHCDGAGQCVGTSTCADGGVETGGAGAGGGDTDAGAGGSTASGGRSGSGGKGSGSGGADPGSQDAGAGGGSQIGGGGSDGCGCSVPGQQRSTPWAFGLAGLALLVARRRRATTGRAARR